MPGLGGGGARSRHVSFVDDCAVQYVPPRWEIEVVCWILFEAEGFERRESVNCGQDGLLFKGFDGHMARCRGGNGGDGGFG